MGMKMVSLDLLQAKHRGHDGDNLFDDPRAPRGPMQVPLMAVPIEVLMASQQVVCKDVV